MLSWVVDNYLSEIKTEKEKSLGVKNYVEKQNKAENTFLGKKNKWQLEN